MLQSKLSIKNILIQDVTSVEWVLLEKIQQVLSPSILSLVEKVKVQIQNDDFEDYIELCQIISSKLSIPQALEPKIYSLLDTIVAYGHCSQKNFLDAISCNNKAINIRLEHGIKSDLITNYLLAIRIYSEQQNLDLVYSYCKKALEVYLGTKNMLGSAEMYTNLGVISVHKNDFQRSEEFFSKSIELYSQLYEFENVSMNYVQMGIVAKNNGLYQEAFQYYNHAKIFAEKTTNPLVWSHIFVNEGNLLQDLGSLFNAEQSYLKALEFFEENNDPDFLKVLFMNLGNLYARQEKFEQSEQSYIHALTYATTISDVVALIMINFNMGKMYLMKQENDKAKLNFGFVYVKASELNLPIAQNALEALIYILGNQENVEKFIKNYPT